MRVNTRHSANFQLHQIFDPSSLQPPSSFNDFGNFIYKDHVTRIKYNFDNLKTKKANINADQTIQSFINTHKKSKSTCNLQKIHPSKFHTGRINQIEIKKKELLHFLSHLQMMNKIRHNRNHILSGAQKIEKRKSLFPSLNQSLHSPTLKINDIDIIKQQIRKQVDELSTQIFRDYMENSEPYRIVFNELNTVSSKGALNTGKIKQIKQKIEECTKIKRKKGSNEGAIVKRRQLNTKENERYEQYFTNAAKEIDEAIHLKVNHEATFNWKYGKRQSMEEQLRSYEEEESYSQKGQI